jgi:hypothetical protein
MLHQQYQAHNTHYKYALCNIEHIINIYHINSREGYSQIGQLPLNSVTELGFQNSSLVRDVEGKQKQPRERLNGEKWLFKVFC